RPEFSSALRTPGIGSRAECGLEGGPQRYEPRPGTLAARLDSDLVFSRAGKFPKPKGRRRRNKCQEISFHGSSAYATEHGATSRGDTFAKGRYRRGDRTLAQLPDLFSARTKSRTGEATDCPA